MKKIKVISEHEMILTFLRGDIDSPKCVPIYTKLLNEYKLSRKIIDSPDLTNTSENSMRLKLFSRARGYKLNNQLFVNFPKDTRWEKAIINKEELLTIRQANYKLKASEGRSRLVTNHAQKISIYKTDAWATYKGKVDAIIQGTKTNKSYPALICVTNEKAETITLLDGYHRTTAYILMLDTLPNELEVIVGFSNNIHLWLYW